MRAMEGRQLRRKHCSCGANPVCSGSLEAVARWEGGEQG